MNFRSQLFLVRHGLPDYRCRIAPDEPPGPPLSETGKLQATQSAQHLAKIGATPDIIWTSPLSRARQTAEILARQIPAPVRTHPDLAEWRRTEKLHDVAVRAARFLRAWRESNVACGVAVGHASPLLALLREALRLPHASWWQGRDRSRLVLNTVDRFEFSMASVFELEFTDHATVAAWRFHPSPRISHVAGQRRIAAFERPTLHGEGREFKRQFDPPAPNRASRSI